MKRRFKKVYKLLESVDLEVVNEIINTLESIENDCEEMQEEYEILEEKFENAKDLLSIHGIDMSDYYNY